MEWQTSIGTLIGAAEGRDFLMHSRIGVLHALDRNVEGILILVTKTHWEKLGRQNRAGNIREPGQIQLRECGRFITVAWFFRWSSCFDSRVSAASISF